MHNVGVAPAEPLSNEEEEVDFPYWTNVEGKIMVWDDPSLVGGIRRPKRHRPLNTLSSVRQKYEQGVLKPEDVVILKILGDAMCANENQLRRYLELNDFSRSKVSDRLKRLRELGMVSRWYVHSQEQTDDKPPPAPFTLDLGGFNLLKDMYGSDRFFVFPDKWYQWGVKVVQRYVAMNEIRLQLAEKRYMKNWMWNPILGGDPRYSRPHGVVELGTSKGRMNLVIERGQQSKDFLHFFQDKIEKYNRLHKKHGSFQVYDKRPDETIVNTNNSVLVLYCSTRSIAVEAMQQLDMSEVSFPVWFLIEEDMIKDTGINKAFLIPKDGKLKRFDISTMF